MKIKIGISTHHHHSSESIEAAMRERFPDSELEFRPESGPFCMLGEIEPGSGTFITGTLGGKPINISANVNISEATAIIHRICREQHRLAQLQSLKGS